MVTKQSLEQEVGVLYGKIYGYTDIGGDSVLEFMDEWLTDENKFDLFMEYINNDEFNEETILNDEFNWVKLDEDYYLFT